MRNIVEKSGEGRRKRKGRKKRKKNKKNERIGWRAAWGRAAELLARSGDKVHMKRERGKGMGRFLALASDASGTSSETCLPSLFLPKQMRSGG